MLSCGADGLTFDKYFIAPASRFRLGDKTFFGPGSSFAVDSTKVMTVVTQFVTSDNTDTGELKEIRRLFVQDGKVIPTAPTVLGGQSFDAISDSFNAAQKRAFNNTDTFSKRGGMKAMGDAFDRGMVLVLSLWDDYDVHVRAPSRSSPPRHFKHAQCTRYPAVDRSCSACAQRMHHHTPLTAHNHPHPLHAPSATPTPGM